MEKHKEMPRYSVVSVRVTDEEKAYLAALSRRDQTTVSDLMRKAMHRCLVQRGLDIRAAD